MDNCVFCNIIYKENERILYENENFLIVPDIKPDAKVHLLAITKKHIINANYLTKDELPMLLEIKDKIEEYMKLNYPNQEVM